MKRIRTSVIAAAAAAAVVALPGSASAAPLNLALNGGFEQPGIGGWGVFSSIPGWTTSSGCGIEVQNHVAGAPYEGTQFVELDSDCKSAMTQAIPTVAGRWYTVSWAFSARPGVADNVLRVSANAATLATVSADGSALADTSWRTYTEAVQATSATTALTFADVSGADDSLGVYVDAVSFAAAPVTAVDACKNGGWMNYVDAAGNAFKNQGDCVSFVATKGRNVAAG